MAVIGVRELKAKASQIIQRSEKGEAFLVTRRGRPVSVLLPLDMETEDLLLAELPRFIRLRERGRREFREGRTVPWRELRSNLQKTSGRGLAR